MSVDRASVPGTPASPIIYNAEVYVQGSKFSPSVASSLVSPSDYTAVGVMSPGQDDEFLPSTGGGGEKKYVCASITPYTLTCLLDTNTNVVGLPEWNHMTHLVYRGLNVTPAGKVMVEGDGPHCRVLGSAFTYVQLLQAIKRAHPHLSIIWSFPAPFKRGVFMERMIMEPAASTFWSTLDYTLLHVQADGCELNLEHVCHFPANFISDLINFAHRASLHLVLNNRVQWRHDKALNFLNCMQSLVGKIVVNSFGYYDYMSPDEDSQGPRIMVRSMESALYHFEMSLQQLVGTVPRHKILMGIDTCGVMFKTGLRNQADLNLIPLREIQRIFQTGYEDDMYRKWYFDCHYSGVGGGSCMMSRDNGDVGSLFISYDSYFVRRRKVKFVLDECLGGVNMGDLSEDLHFSNRRSLINICHYYLTQSVEVADFEFCENEEDDKCEENSVFIIDP